MHQSIPLIFILYIFLLRFSNYNAIEDKRLEKSLTLSDWMENYPEQQETGNTGDSNTNVPMNDDNDKVVTEHLFINTAVSRF
uniref:Candidate secreted effector n=1 Tax=Meloidogyne incognita TaxID=6306 RepID=A0A914MZ14_MELIC